MSNPLFQMGQQGGGMPNILQRFQQFQRMFSGDPKAQVQQLMNSGRISQEQYNQAVQMAQQLARIMGGK